MTAKGWNQSLMMSLFTKETAYNAAVTVNSTNFCTMKGHSDYDPDWADRVETDKGEVTGYEHGTDLEIIEQAFKFSYAEPKARPNSLIGLSNLVLGSRSSTQDTGYTAYCHTLTPVAVGSTLPSVNVIGLKGGLQYLHTGVRGNSIEISGEEGGPIGFSSELIGSGYRATNADSFANKVSESWLLSKNSKIWMESGTDISISASPVQNAEDISSSTPDSLHGRVRKFSVKINNNLESFPGFGAGGILTDLDYGRRTVELSLDIRWLDGTELAHYLAMNALALEIDCRGSIIQAGGTMFYGFQIIIPRFKLLKPVLPKGGPNDTLTTTYECDVQDDGTNPVIKLLGYNAKSAYLA